MSLLASVPRPELSLIQGGDDPTVDWDARLTARVEAGKRKHGEWFDVKHAELELLLDDIEARQGRPCRTLAVVREADDA